MTSEGGAQVDRIVRRLGIAAAVLSGVLMLGALAVFVVSERTIRRTFDVSPEPLRVALEDADRGRGEHLVRATAQCVLCHGDDLGGAVYADLGLMGTIAGPNLTRGRGGVAGVLGEDDWVRAIRHGVRRDGRSMMVMPSEVYTHLSDEDLAAIIAYLRSAPPVDREMPPSRFGPAGRVLLAAGKLNILVAPKTHEPPSRPAVERAPTVEYGRYLADIAGCHGCHGFGLSGGRVAGPPGLPPASNLTPAGPLAGWSEAEFARAMRTGVRPDGTLLDEFMPWRTLARLDDVEVGALWRYLRSVAPRAFGNK
jgi:mono/diheme cytochrome c family protein